MRMNDLNANLPILDVPYFQLTRFSTCGPAALMMVLKYWDKSFELSKGVEFQMWIKSNPFVFFGGTLQFGLAKTALKKVICPRLSDVLKAWLSGKSQL